MADQTTNFNVKADTSTIEKLSQSLKALDDNTSKIASSFSNLNRINQSAPKSINEFAESFSGLGQKIKQSVVDIEKFTTAEKTSIEVAKDFTNNLKQRAAVTSSGGIPPPVIPPIIAAGAGAGGDDPRNRAFNLAASIHEINAILKELGINLSNISDQGSLDKLRSKINALAQAAGGGTSQAVRTLGDAFERIQSGNLDPVVGNLKRTIDALLRLKSTFSDIEQQRENEKNKEIQRLEEIDRVRAKSSQLLENVAFKARQKDLIEAEKLLETEKKLTLQRQAAIAAPTLIKGALGELGISDKTIAGLDPGRAQTARVAINNLAAAMIAGKVSALELTQAVQSFGTKGITVLTGGAAFAQAQLGQLKTVTQATTGIFAEAANNIVGIIGRILVRRGIFALITAVKDGIAESVKFDSALTRLGITGEISAGGIESLKNKIEALSLISGRPRLDLANAELELLRNRSFNAGNSLEGLNTAVDLSKTTFSTVQESAKTLSETLGEFGLNASDTARTAKLLFAATKAGGADLSEVRRVLESTNVSSRALGLSLEEVVATFVTFRDQGLSAGRASTAVSSLFSRLVQSSDELNKAVGTRFQSAQEAVRTLGLQETLRLIGENSKDAAGKVKALGDILGDADFNKFSDSLKKVQNDVKGFGDALDRANSAADESFKRAVASFQHNFIQPVSDFTKSLFAGYVNTLQAIANNISPTSPVAEEVRKKIEEIKKAQEEAANAAERSNQKTLRSYEGLFTNVRQNAFNTLLELRRNFQANGVAVEENFKTLSELVKKITSDANTTIRQAQRDITSFAEEVSRRSFEKRIQILPPAQQFQELQQRLNEVVLSAEEFAKKGKLQEANTGFKEAAGLLLKFEEINDRLSQQQGKIAVATDRNFRQHIINIDKITGSQDKLSTENIRFLNQEFNLLTRNAKSIDDPFIRANAINEITARQLVVRQRTALEGLQKDQQLTSQTAIISEKAIQEKEKTGLLRIEALQKQQKAIQDQINAAQQRQPKAAGGLDTLLESFRGATSLLGEENIQDKIRKSIPVAQEALANFVETGKGLPDLKDKIENVLQVIERNPTEAEKFANTIAVIRGTLIDLGRPSVEVTNLTSQLNSVNSELARVSAQSPIASGQITEAFKNASASSEGLTKNIYNFNAALDQSLQRLDGILGKINAINLRPPAIDEGGGGGFQRGGLITGGRPGVDSNLIRVSRGEFIVNADSVRKFYPQVSAINAGRFPGFQHGGLVSNTTVGNISVNVTAQNTEQGNIREIGRALNREIRRGTIKF